LLIFASVLKIVPLDRQWYAKSCVLEGNFIN
jgi:hypothetical protein